MAKRAAMMIGMANVGKPIVVSVRTNASHMMPIQTMGLRLSGAKGNETGITCARATRTMKIVKMRMASFTNDPVSEINPGRNASTVMSAAKTKRRISNVSVRSANATGA